MLCVGQYRQPHLTFLRPQKGGRTHPAHLPLSPRNPPPLFCEELQTTPPFQMPRPKKKISSIPHFYSCKTKGPLMFEMKNKGVNTLLLHHSKGRRRHGKIGFAIDVCFLIKHRTYLTDIIQISASTYNWQFLYFLEKEPTTTYLNSIKL